MAALPSDLNIVGIVLAVAVAIILLSGLVLYLAFRVRETFHEQKGGGARTAKVGLLIGLLFLSGGVFYYFAVGLNSSGPVTSQTSSTSTVTISSSTPSSSTSGSTSSSTTSSTITSTASVPGSSVSMTVTYPSTVATGQGFYIEFNIYNSRASNVSAASLDVGNLIFTFTVTSATKCNTQCTTISRSGSVFSIGNLVPGQTVVTIGVTAPGQPQQYSGSAALYYQGAPQPAMTTITIRVTGHP